MTLPNTASINDVIAELSDMQAINQKSELASVIGTPATATDTVAQQIIKLQESKDSLASNISNKGVPTASTESIANMSEKVSQIVVGEVFSQGTTTSTPSNQTFQYYGSSVNSSTSAINVSLNFKPTRVEIRSSGATFYLTNYYSNLSGLTDVCIAGIYTQGLAENVSNYTLKANAGSGYVNETGFRLPVLGANTSYSWKAYK